LGRKAIPNFESKRAQLLGALDLAHDTYYKSEVFGGPSLYFHQQALRAGRDGDLRSFADRAYAVLAAWGMHRMGPNGSKMREFSEFVASLEPLWSVITGLRQAEPDHLDETGWRDLRSLFCGIRCMRSGTSLVGNSKVLAHALPNLVPPVDREYTLRFLFGNTNITNDIAGECAKLESILRGFFYPVARSAAFKAKAQGWMGQPDTFRWDTSPLKIVDNLVIGLERHRRGEDAGALDP
jgi:hypothetical protein